MTERKNRNCSRSQCQQLYRHPLYIVTPAPNSTRARGNNGDERVIVAAQLKCTCSDDIHINGEVNAADLCNLKPKLRWLIYNHINSSKSHIPVIDPERINSCTSVTFITGFSRKIFRSWMALDLLTVEQFTRHIENKDITIEEVRI